jgi:hypothetical protein
LTDDALRRKLLRDYLGELVIMTAIAVVVGALVFNLLHMALTRGIIVLNAGSRSGPVVPVEITWNATPFALAGALCISLAFFGFVASLTVSPAYHVLRTGVPSLQLPRIPKSHQAKLARRFLFTTMSLLATLGASLVVVQYLLLGRS